MEIQVKAGGEVRRLKVKRGENLMEALFHHGVTLPRPRHFTGYASSFHRLGSPLNHNGLG